MDRGEGMLVSEVGTRRRARSDVVLSVILLVTLVAFAAAVYVGQLTTDDEREADRREAAAALGEPSARLVRVERDLADLSEALPPGITEALNNVASAVDGLGRTVGSVRSEVDGLRLDIDGVRSCVNEYMDAIGRWSSNVSSRYTYFCY